MRAWVILFLAIASEVVGTIALKYAVDHFWIYGVAAFVSSSPSCSCTA